MPFLDQASAPEDLRIYAIGDVHGRLDLLTRLHADIAADLARRPCRRFRVIHLGDLIDRGPDSRGVIDRLIEFCRDGDAVALRGNHDTYLLRFLEGEKGTAGDWLAWGGEETVVSYGLARPHHGMRLDHLRDALRDAVPEAHRDFFSSLPLFERWGDYVFVHAGVKPGRSLARQSEHDLIWIREPFLSDARDHGFVVVHGHTAGDLPVVRRNRICCDTRAYASDRLTCLVLEDALRGFLHDGRYVSLVEMETA